MRIWDVKSRLRRLASSPRSTTQTLGAILLTLGLVLAPLNFIGPLAAAQATPVVSIGDIEIADVNGTFNVTVNLDTLGTATTGLSLAITYDPALIQPVLNTSPVDGIVGSPRCTRLNGAGGACGPTNPTNMVVVSLFRASGAWQGDFDLLEVEFEGQGLTGVSPLTIAIIEVLDLNTQPITADAADGSVTLGSEPAPATPTPIPGNADLSISKSVGVSGPLLPGSTLSYTILGSNTGPDPASNVVIIDALPDGLSLAASPVATGWSCGITDRILTCTRATLAVDQNFVLSYDAVVDLEVPRGTTLANEVSISASTTDPNAGNNTAAAPVTIAPDSATPTPGPSGPTTTPTPVPTNSTPTPTTAANPTATPTPDPDATATPTPTAVATATVTPTPAGTPQPTVPVLPTPEPALEYPGPFTNAPPSGARGDGFLVQPNAQSVVGQADADAGAASSSTSDAIASTPDASGDSSSLAITGAETPLLATLSLALIAIGGSLLVIARRENLE